MTRSTSSALPLLFDVLTLAGLWLHLSTGDRSMLFAARLGVGIGVVQVLHQRAVVGRLGRLSFVA